MEPKVPFFVKLAHQGVSFLDSVSGLYVSGDSKVKVTVLTPETRRWIREGGLVVSASEEEAPSDDEAKASTESGGAEPTNTGTDAGKGNGPENANQGGEGSGEQSIEDLLKGEEETQPANSRGKNKNK